MMFAIEFELLGRCYGPIIKPHHPMSAVYHPIYMYIDFENVTYVTIDTIDQLVSQHFAHQNEV